MSNEADMDTDDSTSSSDVNWNPFMIRQSNFSAEALLKSAHDHIESTRKDYEKAVAYLEDANAQAQKAREDLDHVNKVQAEQHARELKFEAEIPSRREELKNSTLKQLEIQYEIDLLNVKLTQVTSTTERESLNGKLAKFDFDLKQATVRKDTALNMHQDTQTGYDKVSKTRSEIHKEVLHCSSLLNRALIRLEQAHRRLESCQEKQESAVEFLKDVERNSKLLLVISHDYRLEVKNKDPGFLKQHARCLLLFLELFKKHFMNYDWRNDGFGLPMEDVFLEKKAFEYLNDGEDVFESRTAFYQQLDAKVRHDFLRGADAGRQSLNTIFAPTRVGKSHTLRKLTQSLQQKSIDSKSNSPHIYLLSSFTTVSFEERTAQSLVAIERCVSIRLLYRYDALFFFKSYFFQVYFFSLPLCQSCNIIFFFLCIAVIFVPALLLALPCSAQSCMISLDH